MSSVQALDMTGDLALQLKDLNRGNTTVDAEKALDEVRFADVTVRVGSIHQQHWRRLNKMLVAPRRSIYRWGCGGHAGWISHFQIV